MKRVLLFCLLFLAVRLSAQDLQTAQKEVDAEKFESATLILENLVRDQPEAGENYFSLGRLYLKLNEDKKAEETFKKGLDKKDKGNLNYVGLGQIALSNGNTAEAEANFTKALQNIKKKDTKELIAIAGAYTYSDNPDYAKAIGYAKKAVGISSKLADAYLVLGDAEYRNKNVNDAYSAYRNAFDANNNYLRAKLQLAVITKGSNSFPETVTQLNDIVAINPNYGPVYREFAETYYLWSSVDPTKSEEYIPKALSNYEKYMSLTDYSLDSRMRHADFLVLTKDYKALEKEASEMQKIDKVNPRILRYLGISAYENGNYKEAVTALNEFISKVEPKRVVGYDYLYLTKSHLAMAMQGDSVVDNDAFDKAMTYMKKTAEKNLPLSDFGDLAINLYKAKKYDQSAKIFENIIDGSKATLFDNMYFANAVFYNAAAMEDEQRAQYQDMMKKADQAFAVVIKGAPTTQDAYFNKARLNRYILSDESEKKIVEDFEGYIKAVTEKGDTELSKENIRIRMSEAYTTVGAYYAETDAEKAIANFEKAIEFDPTNDHAQSSLNFLKK